MVRSSDRHHCRCGWLALRAGLGSGSEPRSVWLYNSGRRSSGRRCCARCSWSNRSRVGEWTQLRPAMEFYNARERSGGCSYLAGLVSRVSARSARWRSSSVRASSAHWLGSYTGCLTSWSRVPARRPQPRLWSRAAVQGLWTFITIGGRNRGPGWRLAKVGGFPTAGCYRGHYEANCISKGRNRESRVLS